jgi:hypothetical protein
MNRVRCWDLGESEVSIECLNEWPTWYFEDFVSGDVVELVSVGGLLDGVNEGGRCSCS